MLTIITVLVLAAVAGFWAQRRLHRGHPPEHPLAHVGGLPVSGRLSGDRGGAVLSMAEDAVLLTPGARRGVLGQL